MDTFFYVLKLIEKKIMLASFSLLFDFDQVDNNHWVLYHLQKNYLASLFNIWLEHLEI